MPKKRSAPTKSTRVKAVARKKVGSVPPARPLKERQLREKPKYKKPIDSGDEL
jgi:hypothetical protein